MTAPRATTDERRRRILIALVIALGLGLAAAALWQRYSPEAQAQARTRLTAETVLAEFRKGLPRPFGEGLVTDRVDFEGQRLVFTIRSTTRLATEAARDTHSLDAVRDAEQEQMLAFCDDAQLVHLLARNVVVTRRFVDQKGDRFFEVSLTSADCARPR